MGCWKPYRGRALSRLGVTVNCALKALAFSPETLTSASQSSIFVLQACVGFFRRQLQKSGILKPGTCASLVSIPDPGKPLTHMGVKISPYRKW